MRSYAAQGVPAITAVAGALVAVVSVCRSCPGRRVISSNWRRVGFLTSWAALVAWSVWLLGSVGLVTWQADGLTMKLPWYGSLVLVALAVWLIGVLDEHRPRFRARNPEPDREPERTPLIGS